MLRGDPLRTTGGSPSEFYAVTHELPAHLREWVLPPGWRWGAVGMESEHRHFQEIVDALGRSLSLVTAPDAAHHQWLYAEAKHLAHRSDPSIPTTYHYWTSFAENRRGPGYLRRWIAGETIGSHVARHGAYEVPAALHLLRTAAATLAYLHDTGTVHGAIGTEALWVTPTGRLWYLGWQWALPREEIPGALHPDWRTIAVPPEWHDGAWSPTAASDQWQLGAASFATLTGELPPSRDAPPVRLVRGDVPREVAAVLDRALHPDPEARHHNVAALLRALDRAVGTRTAIVTSGRDVDGGRVVESAESRLRWATGDDYEVLSSIGSGSFGSVWRVRDLTLGREVALKMLHAHVARDDRAVGRFKREARLAAQLAHPAIVPIYDWDTRGDVVWYTMELAEGGSLAELIARSGPRPLGEVAPQVDLVLDGLAAAHASDIVHRDLKPENIVIDRYGRWRISDFGIAQIAGEERGGTTGTPAFAAPEQLLGEAQGPAADCFAMTGIVMFALSGQPPFGAGDVQALLARQLMQQVDLSPYAEPVAAWIREGLAPDPARRFADAAAMQRAWREVVDAALERDREVPWWRRWLGGDEEGVAEAPYGR